MAQNEAIEQAKEVKAKYQEQLLALPNVVGVGVGLKETNGEFTDQIAIIVNVSKKMPSVDLPPDAIVPPEIEGIATDVQQTGEMRAF